MLTLVFTVSEVHACRCMFLLAFAHVATLPWQYCSTCEVSSLTEEYGLLPGDSLVAAGMVGYAGPFAGEYRAHFEKLWLATEDGEIFCHKN